MGFSLFGYIASAIHAPMVKNFPVSSSQVTSHLEWAMGNPKGCAVQGLALGGIALLGVSTPPPRCNTD